MRFLLLCLSIFLLATATPASAQPLYAPEPGVYLIASPASHPHLAEEQTTQWLGVGGRFGGGAAAEVRVARGEDVPYGNPLPVTRIGHTLVDARLIFVSRGAASTGVQLVVEGLATVVDRSEPVSNVDAGEVTFREGRELSEYAGRVEVSHVWYPEPSGSVDFFPRLGLLGEYRVLRANTIRYDPEGVVGANEESREFTPAVTLRVGVSLPLGGSSRLVVEPHVEALPTWILLPRFRGGVEASLNL